MTTPKPIGRPSDYDPKYCDMLIEHMSKGLSYASFGAVIDVVPSTIYLWEQKHPEFSEAKKRGFQNCLLWWEHQAQKGLWNDKEGSTLNTTLWIYNMKCRFPAEWREQQEISHKVIGEKKELKQLSDGDLSGMIIDVNAEE